MLWAYRGVVTVNATDPVYPTLSAAIDSLNNQGVGDGGVTITVAPGNPQTAPAGGYVITASGDISKQIIIDGNIISLLLSLHKMKVKSMMLFSKSSVATGLLLRILL